MRTLLLIFVFLCVVGCQSDQKENSTGGENKKKPLDVRSILESRSPEKLKEALDAGLDPNAPFSKNRSDILLMHLVASQGTPEMIQVLADAGADLNCQEERGGTPLTQAIARSQPQNAIKLLELGAKPNIGGGKSLTPLISAISKAQNDVAKKLVTSGAKVNARIDRLSGTALIMAVQLDNKEMVEFLLQHDADPNLTAPNGKKAFEFVKSEEIRKLLEKKNKK